MFYFKVPSLYEAKRNTLFIVFSSFKVIYKWVLKETFCTVPLGTMVVIAPVLMVFGIYKINFVVFLLHTNAFI